MIVFFIRIFDHVFFFNELLKFDRLVVLVEFQKAIIVISFVNFKFNFT